MFRRTTFTSTLALSVPLLLVACSHDDTDSAAGELTYYADAKPIIDAKCATCHQPGDIGPFSLTTFEEVSAFEAAVRSSIENETMPPWMPSDECNDYVGNIDLTDDERSTLLAWIDGGAAEGDPVEVLDDADTSSEDEWTADLTLRLPEPYTPQLEPDDHRCQLIPWPATETRFVTGTRVTPDKRSIVHHVIIFVVGPDQVEEFQAYDDAEEGPGYTCYGGPVPVSDDTAAGIPDGPVIPDQIGFWVPGALSTPFPEGTGIRVEPGSMLVAQVHYNTSSSAPVADQSVIEIATTDSVEREATVMQVVDFGWLTDGRIGGDAMTIPAGEEEVSHDTSVAFDSLILGRARTTLGLADDAPLVLYTAGHHMHELGQSQVTELQHADGSTSCLLDTPDWDFAWQGRYTLSDPVTFEPGDTLWMECTWDNSASNQPIVDGEVQEPVDVSWGEGTSDEMCLSGFYVTGE